MWEELLGLGSKCGAAFLFLSSDTRGRPTLLEFIYLFIYFGFSSIEKSFLPLRFREPQTASLTVSIHHVHTRHTHFLPFPLNSVSTFCVWAFPLPSALFFTCSHISEHLMYSCIRSCFSRGHRLNVQEHASIS